MIASETHKSRRLTVILHADIAESTELVRQDETLAHERIRHAFARFNRSICEYGGSVQEIRGDALVAEFDRVSDALCAAIGFQQSNTEINRQFSDPLKPSIRIGISMGEVVVADGTVTGEGIVLAQRVEQLADPGGICITSAIHEALPRRMPFEQQDMGDQVLKGFEEPVRVYNVKLKAGDSIPLPERRRKLKSHPALALWMVILLVVLSSVTTGAVIIYLSRDSVEQSSNAPGATVINSEKPSIAVLPFDNLSNDSTQEYFSDGVAEDIITDLSRLKSLLVIARNSSFRYRGTSIKVQDIGKDLGVKYLLEGSVRKAGNRVRISVQLIETESGYHLWAERYDRELIDVFAVQDEITARIVSALALKLSADESRQLEKHATKNLEAYDLFLRGRISAAGFNEDGMIEAERLFRQAIDMDPDFARAYGALSILMIRMVNAGFSDTPTETKDRALELAKIAVSLDPYSPQVQWALGYNHMYRREFDQAIHALEKSIELSPSFADGYALLALIKNNLGKAMEAIELIEKGMKLNPYYSYDYLFNLGRAYYALGQHELALHHLKQALERNEIPSQPRLFLIASYVQLDNQDEAEWEVDRLAMTHPDITLSHVRNLLPIEDSELMGKLIDDLRIAGMAE